MTLSGVAPRSTADGWRRHAGFGAFVGLFAAVLGFFSYVDVHNAHFFEAGFGPLYNSFRVVFTAYYFWMIAFVGLRTLSLVAGREAAGEVPVHERLALGFFAGAAVVTAGMLALGFLSLYLRWLVGVAAVILVAASYGSLSRLLDEAGRALRDRFAVLSVVEKALLAVAAVVLLAAASLLMLVKGLYPQGGHDYYLHYFQYYSRVIDLQGIWPNEFWYHYFYSKGLGVFFLAMLLTDNLAPSLVGFCFACAAAIALFSLVQRVRPDTLWPWAAAIVYLALNVHTLGTGIYGANGGWGHFQKPHELNTPVLIGILWMSVRMVSSTGAVRRAWWWAIAACSFVVSYLVIISSAIVGIFFALGMAGSLAFRGRDALAFFGLGVATACGLASVLIVNFVTIGIPSDLGIHVWWPMLDLAKLDREGWLFDMVFAVQLRADVLRGLASHGLGWPEFLLNASRLDLLTPFALSGIAAVVLGLVGLVVVRQSRPGSGAALPPNAVATAAIVAPFVLSVVLFGLTLGTSEPISYVRSSSYNFILMILVPALAWQFALAAVAWPRVVRGVVAWLVPVAVAAVTLQQAYAGHRGTLSAVVENAARFVDGRYSIYDAYRDQSGWPALPKSGAIFPPIFEAWKTMKPGSRLWSFHVHTYCMVPGCYVESHLTSNLSAERDAILTGTAEEERAALQRAGVNDFFISLDLDIRDPMICTPLFSPDTIGDYMGVKWMDGPNVLLTWKGPETRPLPSEWVDKYRAHLKPGKYTPDCSRGGPEFTRDGHFVRQQVLDGKRWGRDVVLPK